MHISSSVVADMLAHAHEEAPRECCGLLIGSADAVVRSVRARNADPAPTRYLVDPGDHFKALRLARAVGLEVIGAYHSHPAGAAVPSATDITEARSGKDFVYVIVSPANGDVRAYRIAEGIVTSVSISS
jgi:proteasome lid subunit RPN8/RPN11